MNTDKIVKLVRYFSGIPKSIYVNLRLLPLKQAIYLPIVVSRKTKLQSLSGTVSLDKIKTGIVRIGFGGTDMLDYRYDRTIIKITGNIHFKGKAKVGVGAKLFVSGNLSLGNNLNITGDTFIICAKKISIGDDVMIAWQSIIMDTDQHEIHDKDDKHINEDKEIIIGKNVWIGARSFILKNTIIPNGSIVGANTTVTKQFEEESTIIGGNPARILKEEVSWNH
ncbi:MAG: acyltransferase [Sulfurimonas sp.]